MVNELLVALEKRHVLEGLGEEATLGVVRDFVDISNGYDCNVGEVLSGVGSRLGICFYCLERSPDLVRGLCPRCKS